jgi:hypothetical protein
MANYTDIDTVGINGRFHPHSFMSDCSLGASWAFSFQQVLQPDNRPRFHSSEVGLGVFRSNLNSAVLFG